MSVLILKNFREDYGVSREKQAILLGITVSALNTWEYRNKKIPNSKLRFVELTHSEYIKELSKDKDVAEVLVGSASFSALQIDAKLDELHNLLQILTQKSNEIMVKISDAKNTSEE